jgi:hypothetical protein
MKKHQTESPCLHCALARVMEKYLDLYGVDNNNDVIDSTVLFAALADVTGDLLANSEQMFSRRDSIMSTFTSRAIDRAQEFLDEERGARLH